MSAEDFHDMARLALEESEAHIDAMRSFLAIVIDDANVPTWLKARAAILLERVDS